MTTMLDPLPSATGSDPDATGPGRLEVPRPYRIRVATEADVEEYVHTHIALNAITYAHYAPPEFARNRRADYADRVQELTDEIAEAAQAQAQGREPFRQHWVAENSLGTIVGVMSAGRGVEPWERRIVGDAWFDSGAAYALSHLYLVPGVHGSGLAQEMLDVGLPERRPAYLWAYDDNLRARAFYRKNGFAPDGLQTLSGEHWGNMPMSRWVRPDVVRP
ncbi:MAG: GNAT family N-acetyltransferase [Propionibacteriaceae bacterium]|nr:GNAT family N-acetyltransferase [Micropruina sp.]HBY22323.1 hypothetical protein [Propionibacteriaceae bacterium]